jgi:hypothetical protein
VNCAVEIALLLHRLTLQHYGNAPEVVARLYPHGFSVWYD